MEISRALVAVTRATRYANRIALYTPTRIVIGSRQKSPFRLLATLALQSFSLHQSLSSPLRSLVFSKSAKSILFVHLIDPFPLYISHLCWIILMNEKHERNLDANRTIFLLFFRIWEIDQRNSMLSIHFHRISRLYWIILMKEISTRIERFSFFFLESEKSITKEIPLILLL